MSGTIEISDVWMTVNMPDGGKIVFGNWGDDSVNTAVPLPPLTPEEELYGRGLCLLPEGWEDLSGDGCWQYHLSKSLRHLWPSFSREQKMAIAFTTSELSDELRDSQYAHCW
ncbi:Uncharacterised protein [Enterobacter hormaechei]|uniref:hypothetical protein n=1 Tax=Enterobacter hormaechei TaxID=158836 RepID=UPI0007998C5A|nr:hypothetical protein [Enterobacter hormaechei]MKW15586.1 hypothetical protein [Salmonella enterica subsp. enterica]HDF8568300.1 hypothetical protein [Enterobacter hormaechei subsp. hoffmannii]TRL61112.1 hypothetical protein FMV79_20830 [Enterobacter hormaechei]CZW82155.1 Uncharacterised protein [Enterobacter hormaechei]SAB27408.1 Uncharacterised protein [Enterobacter hormaechei]